MTRTVDVHLKNDGSVEVEGGSNYPGPAKEALRHALADIAHKSFLDEDDSIVQVHQLDGQVSTINALRDGSIRKPQPKDPAIDLRTPVRPERKVRSLGKIIAATAIAGVVLGGTAVALTQIGTGTESSAVEAPTTAPDITRPAPPGWSQQVAWELATLGESGPAIATNRVVSVGPGSNIRAINAETGALIWASLPVADIGDNTPVVGRSDDGAFVAVKAGTTIAVVPMANSGTQIAPVLVPATPTAQLFSQGEGVMVVDSDLPPATLAADGTLRPITIPPGHAIYEVLSDGSAVAARAEGGWAIVPAIGAPTPVTPAVPADAVDAPHPAASARGIVSAWWNTADPAQRVVSFHDARSGAVIASTRVPAHTVEDGLPTVASEDRTLLSAGPVLVNTASDEAVYVENWLPSNATAGNIFGTRGGQRAVWSAATKQVTAMVNGAAVPWLVSDGGLAIVLDQQGDLMRLAAIRPRTA